MRVNFVNRDYSAVTVRWNAGASNGSFTLRKREEYPINGGGNEVDYAWKKSSNNITESEFQRFGCTILQ